MTGVHGCQSAGANQLQQVHCAPMTMAPCTLPRMLPGVHMRRPEHHCPVQRRAPMMMAPCTLLLMFSKTIVRHSRTIMMVKPVTMLARPVGRHAGSRVSPGPHGCGRGQPNLDDGQLSHSLGLALQRLKAARWSLRAMLY